MANPHSSSRFRIEKYLLYACMGVCARACVCLCAHAYPCGGLCWPEEASAVERGKSA